MSRPTFNYFPIRARGFVGRALLHAAGVEFNDNRIAFDQWEAVKPTTPFGHIPTYEDSTIGVLTESGAIARYLARQHGLAGRCPKEQARVDEVFDIFQDIFRAAFTENFGDNAEAGRAAFLARIPGYVSLVQRLLERNGNTGFLVGDAFSLADVQAFNVINNWLRPLAPSVVAPLQGYLDGVRRSNPGFNSFTTGGHLAATTLPAPYGLLHTAAEFAGEFAN